MIPAPGLSLKWFILWVQDLNLLWMKLMPLQFAHFASSNLFLCLKFNSSKSHHQQKQQLDTRELLNQI